MLKAVIFDFDGTIADTLPLVMEVARQEARKEGYSVPDDLDSLRGLDFGALREMFPVPNYKFPFYYKKIQKLVGERMHEARVFEGVPEVIRKLGRKFKLGLLTANREEYVVNFLREHGLDDYFHDKVTGLSMFGKSGKLRALVSGMGFKIGEAVYVADMKKDIEACRNDNIRIISVTWGYNSRELLEKSGPDFIAGRPEEILEAIDSMSG